MPMTELRNSWRLIPHSLAHSTKELFSPVLTKEANSYAPSLTASNQYTAVSNADPNELPLSIHHCPILCIICQKNCSPDSPPPSVKFCHPLIIWFIKVALWPSELSFLASMLPADFSLAIFSTTGRILDAISCLFSMALSNSSRAFCPVSFLSPVRP